MPHSHFIKSIKIEKGQDIFLSFGRGKDKLKLNDLKRINIFIGENSSGKSNIIRAIVDDSHRNTKGEISISFIGNVVNDDDGQKQSQSNRALNKTNIEFKCFDIPPFRNLIIQNQFNITPANEYSGVVALENIDDNKIEEFYRILGEIIEIPGFKMQCKTTDNFPCCILSQNKDSRYINLSPLIHWGEYTFNGFNEPLDIDLLGWGTKSVIIIFYNLYFNENAIAFIEEPEISTHPKLLKNLFNWAFENRPEIQYFLTTHSSLLIDKVFMGRRDDDWQIFRVYMEKGITKAEPIRGKKSSIELLERLGFQSSNMLFANYVIWVEGPSDIFYYEAFLSMAGYLKEQGNNGNTKKPKLRRGTHYEIMWYGGSLQWRLFDLESKDEMELIFSMCRNGAVFWDYDDGKLKDRHNNIFKYLDKDQELQERYSVGCTGEILNFNGIQNGYINKGKLPITIEHLLTEKIALELIAKLITKKRKRNNIISKIKKNNKSTNKIKLSGGEKIELGQKLLEYVNNMIDRQETDKIKDLYAGNFNFIVKEDGRDVNTVEIYFNMLYEKITKAN